TPQESAALAVKNGCELNCGNTFASLLMAVEEGLITEKEIDNALTRLFTARFRLGMFDPEDMVPYAKIPFSVNDCHEHRQLALETARESIVLLKNQNNLLPLPKNLKNIAVIGPNADSLEVLLGNYEGTPSKYITPLNGIREKIETATKVYYTPGCHLTNRSKAGFTEAIIMAEKSDAVIMVLGLSPRLEGEEGDGEGDRTHIDLPGVQEDLIKAIHATGKPIVLVLINGSALAVNWANENIPAIIELWYSGEEGGTALADVIFGDYNPAGRLPVTFPKSLDQVPPFTDYNMANRTYRYMKDKPLYTFGYGLSYTKFAYSNLRISKKEVNANENVTVQADVENVGYRDGQEVVQLYISTPDSSIVCPIHSLQGFTRISLRPGEKKSVEFRLAPQQFAVVNDEGKFIVEPGRIIVSIGGGQPGMEGETTGSVSGSFQVISQPKEIA
ncbi:glycoside hydrolase family 3 protein, partial [Candidatus Poribacteria bacterium]|nr:glycoside hydrolase family 3 protein [Candidatus Poribacteria bacterium]